MSRNQQLLRMRRRRSRRRAGNKAFTKKFRKFMHRALHPDVGDLIRRELYTAEVIKPRSLGGMA